MLSTRLLRAYPGIEASYRNLRDEFDQMMDTVNGNQPFGAYPVDIREDADHIYVDAELPGFARDEIEVTLENGLLTIQGQRKPRKPAAGEAQHLTERRFTQVARRFTLPNTVSDNQVEARLENGVLLLTLHKREEVKPRKIEVK